MINYGRKNSSKLLEIERLFNPVDNRRHRQCDGPIPVPENSGMVFSLPANNNPKGDLL